MNGDQWADLVEVDVQEVEWLRDYDRQRPKVGDYAAFAPPVFERGGIVKCCG
jgi:hypothetical protein